MYDTLETSCVLYCVLYLHTAHNVHKIFCLHRNLMCTHMDAHYNTTPYALEKQADKHLLHTVWFWFETCWELTRVFSNVCAVKMLQIFFQHKCHWFEILCSGCAALHLELCFIRFGPPLLLERASSELCCAFSEAIYCRDECHEHWMLWVFLIRFWISTLN